MTLSRLSRPTRTTAAALAVAAIGIVIQIIGGVNYPAVPPGLIILLAAAALVAFLPWRWAPVFGVLAGAFMVIGAIAAANARPQAGGRRAAAQRPASRRGAGHGGRRRGRPRPGAAPLRGGACPPGPPDRRDGAGRRREQAVQRGQPRHARLGGRAAHGAVRGPGPAPDHPAGRHGELTRARFTSFGPGSPVAATAGC